MSDFENVKDEKDFLILVGKRLHFDYVEVLEIAGRNAIVFFDTETEEEFDVVYEYKRVSHFDKALDQLIERALLQSHTNGVFEIQNAMRKVMGIK